MTNAIENMNAALANLTEKAGRAEQAMKAGQDNIALIRSIVERRNREKARQAMSDKVMPTLAELAEIC